jgi:alkylation response protein AidB-like acyl-CoA dehydrogenase
MRVTTDAVQILGGYGIIEEYPLHRMMRDGQSSPDLRRHQPDPAPYRGTKPDARVISPRLPISTSK